MDSAPGRLGFRLDCDALREFGGALSDGRQRVLGVVRALACSTPIAELERKQRQSLAGSINTVAHASQAWPVPASPRPSFERAFTDTCFDVDVQGLGRLRRMLSNTPTGLRDLWACRSRTWSSQVLKVTFPPEGIDIVYAGGHRRARSDVDPDLPIRW
jgi:hypothetical protein